MTRTDTAVAVVEQPTSAAMVEWTLDDFPTSEFNRLIPTQTLSIPTDLLRPVVQVVQLNPDPKGGDVYTSRDMPEGHAAPTRVGLRKFATAAGISFIEERRVDDGRDPDVIEMSCLAEMLLPTGQRIHATGTKRIDLNAQVWRSPEHRGKFKSFFAEHVASRAQNRAIRALLSLRGSYPTQVYSKPFAVVSFAPNMAHPEVRERILDVMAGAAGALYGGHQPALGAGKPIDVSPAAEEDPAPATPTVMPGEKIAAAAGDGDPDWITGAKTDATPAPTLVDKLQQLLDASELKGAIKQAQKDRLGPLFGPLSGTGEFGAVIAAAFGEAFIKAPTAAQAEAIITVADSFDADEDFVAAWRAAAAGRDWFVDRVAVEAEAAR